MRGQAGIMEYIFMALFIVFVIVVIVLFLGWWNVNQLGLDHQRVMDNRAFSFLKQLLGSEYIAVENSVLDDSKLTALSSLPDACNSLEEIFGPNVFFEVRIADSLPDKTCTYQNYPDCNEWSFCMPDGRKKSKYMYEVPVNVFRKTRERYDMAFLKAGVWE